MASSPPLSDVMKFSGDLPTDDSNSASLDLGFYLGLQPVACK